MDAQLADTSNETWSAFAAQTAKGQTDAFLHIERRMLAELAAGSSSITRHNQEQLNNLAIAAGLWQQVSVKLSPAL